MAVVHFPLPILIGQIRQSKQLPLEQIAASTFGPAHAKQKGTENRFRTPRQRRTEGNELLTGVRATDVAAMAEIRRDERGYFAVPVP